MKQNKLYGISQFPQETLPKLSIFNKKSDIFDTNSPKLNSNNQNLHKNFQKFQKNDQQKSTTCENMSQSTKCSSVGLSHKKLTKKQKKSDTLVKPIISPAFKNYEQNFICEDLKIKYTLSLNCTFY